MSHDWSPSHVNYYTLIFFFFFLFTLFSQMQSDKILLILLIDDHIIEQLLLYWILSDSLFKAIQLCCERLWPIHEKCMMKHPFWFFPIFFFLKKKNFPNWVSFILSLLLKEKNNLKELKKSFIVSITRKPAAFFRSLM